MIKIILNAFGNAISDLKTSENIAWLKVFGVYALIGFTGIHRFLYGKIKGGIIMLSIFLLFLVAHLFEGIVGFKKMTIFFLGILLLMDLVEFIRGKYRVKDTVISTSFSYEIIILFSVLMLVYVEVLYLILIPLIQR